MKVGESPGSLPPCVPDCESDRVYLVGINWD